MINYTYKDLFEKDTVDKQFVIEVSDGQRIDNTVLYENSFTIEQSIVSGNTLKFGGCNATSVKFRIRNSVLSLIGKTIVVKIYINHNTYEPLELGTYKVETDEYTEGRLYRDVTAYDRLYEICNTDMTDWYKYLPSMPKLTMGSAISALCDYFYIQKTFRDLPFDNVEWKKQTNIKVDGRRILEDYFELNGGFGYINNYNQLCFVKIDNNNPIVKTYKRLQSVKYEDYFAEPIIKVTINDGENTGSAQLDDGNEYIINNNLFLFDKKSDELTTIAETYLELVGNCKYKIMTDLTVKGNPCLEPGDRIWVEDGSVRFDTFVLHRTLTGIQAMKDNVSANGTQYQENVSRRRTTSEQTKANTEAINRMVKTSIKIVWVESEEEVGDDPYTFYCIEK